MDQIPQLYTVKYGANAGKKYYAIKDAQGKFDFFRWATEKDEESTQDLYQHIVQKKKEMDEIYARIMSSLDGKWPEKTPPSAETRL